MCTYPLCPLILKKYSNSRSPFILGKRVRHVYDSLQETNDAVYCQRARDMYNTEPLRTQLLTVTLSETRLLCISDTSLMGREELLKHLQEIDHIR